MLTRVEFRYPTDVLIRYMEQPPGRGERALGRSGEWLFVSKVRPDETGGYLVDCVPAGTYVREAKGFARTSRRLAEDSASGRLTCGSSSRSPPEHGVAPAVGHTFVRPVGSPYAVFQRALRHGNLWVAEAEAREMPRVPLDACKLVCLYAEKESPKFERAAMKWLGRYLDEKEPSEASSPRQQHGDGRVVARIVVLGGALEFVQLAELVGVGEGV